MVFISHARIGEEILQRLTDPARFFQRKNRLPAIVAETLAQILTTQVGGRVRFSFSERCGCSSCPCSPGFVIYAEDTELARSVARNSGRYDRLVFWVDPLKDGGWKIEGRYRQEDFVKTLLVPAPNEATPVTASATPELSN
jgi:hypothetical protein